MINWLQKWYITQCDGEWEHIYGIKITTSDNPGWAVDIDLTSTDLENLEIPYTLYESSNDDWYGYSIKDRKFRGVGDASKLNKIIEIFYKICQNL